MKHRICKKCHKPSGIQKLCRTCQKVQDYHDLMEKARVAALRKNGWVPPEVTPIRTRSKS